MRSLLVLVLWMLAGCGGCSVVFYAMAARAQAIVGLTQTQKVAGHVHYAADTFDVAAGKPTEVELRFHVDEGFHVNSHKPSSELLIATRLSLDPAPTVKIVGTEYPKGQAFHLDVGAGETLDVYQGEFRVKLKVVAPVGMSTLQGMLHYQACDRAACFPPRSLPVTVFLSGK